MKERVAYLDRLISKLRDEQQELMEQYDTLESEIVQHEREADRLEALINDVS